MPVIEHSSLTKEFPLANVERTIEAIRPGMNYGELRKFARQNTSADIPGLLRKRFLLIDKSNRVVYDEFLALVKREGIKSSIVRKVMLFVWAYRDDRIRRFILERIANTSGRWRPSEVTNKTNGAFFQQWYSGAGKARSNFEYFLAETGIFNPTTRELRLELNDNWLEDGARVAAQHEPDPELRRQLLENPYKFLVDQNWPALANCTAKDLLELEPQAIYETEPNEDAQISASPRRRSPSKPWARAKPKSSEKTSTSALIDLVLRERANQSHHAIEKALAAKIRRHGHEPKANAHIDLFFATDDGSVIVEVKSCTEGNFHSQVRKGISQLLEYRFVYADQIPAPIHLALALESEPSPATSWLVQYLASLDISVAWLDRDSSRLITSGKFPKLLDGIFERK